MSATWRDPSIRVQPVQLQRRHPVRPQQTHKVSDPRSQIEERMQSVLRGFRLSDESRPTLQRSSPLQCHLATGILPSGKMTTSDCWYFVIAVCFLIFEIFINRYFYCFDCFCFVFFSPGGFKVFLFNVRRLQSWRVLVFLSICVGKTCCCCCCCREVFTR